MVEEKLKPHTLVIRNGADRTIAPTFEFLAGDDVTGWTAQMVVALDSGVEVFNQTKPVLVTAPNLNIASVFFHFLPAVTTQFHGGKKQNYFVRLIDTNGLSDIYLYGPIDAYVIPGAR